MALLDEPLAPMVLPLPLGAAEDDELLVEGGVLEAAEPEAGGVAVEPLAPIVLPLLLGVLAEELELPVEPLALGAAVLGDALELLELGVLLEPEAPIVPVDGVAGVEGLAPPAAAPEPPALLVPLAAEPPLALVPPPAPALWAMA
ncbi:hypothetical protein ASG30_14745 [Ramlibacter sp. Leaf400]|nr:hypothetical protein ASG30_14745 [Ramlibacter sp. Leaf400]